GVVVVGTGPGGVDGGLGDVLVGTVAQHHAADAPAAVARRHDRHHEPEVGAEVGGQPPVPPRALPEAGAPRVVAQPEPLDRPRLVAHRDGPGSGHVLLVVAASEPLSGLGDGGAVVVHRFAAVHGRDPP